MARRRVRERHVPHLHRLHADDEGVRRARRAAAAWSRCGRRPAAAGRNGSRRRRRRRRTGPAGAGSTDRRGVVALLGARRDVRRVTPARRCGARRRRDAGSSTCSRACTGWRARRRSARRRRSGPRSCAGKNARPPVSCASVRITNSASRKPLAWTSAPRSAIV